MMSEYEIVWLRETGLNDDLGGLGQRILTTAGQGYKKSPYISLDVLEDAAEMLRVKEKGERLDMEDTRYNDALNDLLARFQQAAGRE